MAMMGDGQIAQPDRPPGPLTSSTGIEARNGAAPGRGATLSDSHVHDRLLLRLAFVAAITIAAPAFAVAGELADDKPAVDGWNGELRGGYGYEEAAGATLDAGGTTVSIPMRQSQGWDVGGRLTFPISQLFGGRIDASVGQLKHELSAAGGAPGSDSDGLAVQGGFDLFARDPDSGFFGVGYRFRWGDPALGGIEDEMAHGLSIGTGFYIPDQGMGPVDWNISFDYMRASLDGPSFSEVVNEYSGVASSGWYWTRFLRFTGGLRWQVEEHSASPRVRDLRGSADIAWLLPIGKVRYVTLNAIGSGGRLYSNHTSPLEDERRNVWSVGGSVAFNFPGATSLLQLTRERQ